MYATEKEDLANKSRRAASDARNGANRVKNDLNEAAETLRDDLQEMARTAGRHMRDLADSASEGVSEKVHSNPMQSMLIALGVGFLAGAFFLRK